MRHAAVVVLGLLLALMLPAVPASAVSTIYICNSPRSDSTISIQSTSGALLATLGPGYCRTVADTNNSARVWIPTDSYRAVRRGQPYGSGCNTSSPKTADPPNYPEGYTYWTMDSPDC